MACIYAMYSACVYDVYTVYGVCNVYAAYGNSGGASCRYWLVVVLLVSLDLSLNSSLSDIGRYWLVTYANTVYESC